MNGAETQLPLSKRLLAVLFALVLVVGMAPVSAWAEGEGNAQDSANTQQTDNELNNENSTDVTGGGESSDNADQAGFEASLLGGSGEGAITVASLNDSLNAVADGDTKVKDYSNTFSNKDMYNFLNSNWKRGLGGYTYRLDKGDQYWPNIGSGDFAPKNKGLCSYTVYRLQLGWTKVGTLIVKENVAIGDGDIKDVTYDGSPHKLAPTVKGADDRDLVQGSEYELKYYRGDIETNDFTSAGEIKVVVNFIGNFGDDSYYPSVTKTYNINPAEVTVRVQGDTDQITYDGDEHSVKGFTTSIEEGSNLYDTDNVVLKDGVKAEVSGTNAGTYQMELNPDSFENADPNFNVAIKVTDGSLTIDPAEVTVSVEGNTKTATYSGQEQSVEGFKVIGVKGDDALEYFDYESVLPAESASAKAVGTDAGTYKMGLNEDSFYCANENFRVVEYLVTDGSLTINKRVIEASNSASVVYNGQEQVLNITEANATGLVEGDELYLKNAQVKGTEPGTYTDVTEYDWTVISGNLIVTNNYDLKLSGELTITKADSGSGSAADNGNTGKADKTKASSASPQTGDSIAPFAMAAGIIAIAAALAAFFVSRKLRGTTRR